MEHTKGYLTLKGVIWSLDNKEAMENSATRHLSFGLKTSKDNSLFLQVGEWKNTKLNIKIKGEGMEKPEEVNEQDAIDQIKEIFKDGDSVFINARASVDTYRKKLNFYINQIYIEKEPIDFDAEDFVETNELNQTVIVTEKPLDRKVKVGMTTFKGEMIEQELQLSDNDIKDYFDENVKVGDVMKLSISVNRKPNYLEEEKGDAGTERKTLKGKSVKSGNSYRKIDKDNPYTEFMEVTDVDLEKTEKQKYEKSDIREALELTENIQTKKPKNETSSSNNDDVTPINDEDLPF